MFPAQALLIDLGFRSALCLNVLNSEQVVGMIVSVHGGEGGTAKDTKYEMSGLRLADDILYGP
jgi:hypothetical protein